jgi:hypothetical protein
VVVADLCVQLGGCQQRRLSIESLLPLLQRLQRRLLRAHTHCQPRQERCPREARQGTHIHGRRGRRPGRRSCRRRRRRGAKARLPLRQLVLGRLGRRDPGNGQAQPLHARQVSRVLGRRRCGCRGRGHDGHRHLRRGRLRHVGRTVRARAGRRSEGTWTQPGATHTYASVPAAAVEFSGAAPACAS